MLASSSAVQGYLHFGAVISKDRLFWEVNRSVSDGQSWWPPTVRSGASKIGRRIQVRLGALLTPGDLIRRSHDNPHGVEGRSVGCNDSALRRHESRWTGGNSLLRSVPWRRQAASAASIEVVQSEQSEDDSSISGDDSEEEETDVGSGGDPEHLIIEDGFLEGAQELREHFDSRFDEPRQIRMDRFVWDFWHVPNQYTLIRTPAEDFFPKELYELLEDALLTYGENKLGCRSISPVWLSFYVDGCTQELHADNPHGPWAFVLSLTDWERRRFTGGETVILQPQVLDYWRTFEARRGMELEDLVTLVDPEFNRLTVFDPRLPHGVRPVRGTQDPREARLVLHGWFTEPTPFFTGALEESDAAASLSAALDPLFEEVGTIPPATGTTTVRLTISGSTGAVTDLEWLTDTLVEVPGEDERGSVRDRIQRTIVRHLGGATFPTSDKGDTYLTMPFVFD